MAHGQDVENAVGSRAIRARDRARRRAARTRSIFNSAYLRDRLPVAVAAQRGHRPAASTSTRFATRRGARRGSTATRGPVFLFAGSLIERKNVVRLRDAFEASAAGRSSSSATARCAPSSRAATASG